MDGWMNKWMSDWLKDWKREGEKKAENAHFAHFFPFFLKAWEIKKNKRDTRACTPGTQLAKAACPTAKLRAPGTRARSIFRPGYKVSYMIMYGFIRFSTFQNWWISLRPRTLFQDINLKYFHIFSSLLFSWYSKKIMNTKMGNAIDLFPR